VKAEKKTEKGIDWIHNQYESIKNEDRNEGWGAMDGGLMRFFGPGDV